jgi:hypothetical protein
MISELYQLSSNKQQYGIQGYVVAKTCNYTKRETKFAISKRKDLTYEAKCHEKEPDPTKYSESYEKSVKRYWTKPNGKFFKGKKVSIMEELAKKARNTPGPGAYNKETKNPGHKKGSFRYIIYSKGEKINFLSNAEWYSQETPCSWKYSPSPIKTNYKKGWPKPATAKPIKKDEIGPGKYADGIAKGSRRTMSASISHSFSKSSGSNSIHKRAKDTSFVPGVGTYQNVESAYSKYMIKKSRTPVIFPYKSKGFTDDLVRRSKETPGPGSYNIGPPINK